MHFAPFPHRTRTQIRANSAPLHFLHDIARFLRQELSQNRPHPLLVNLPTPPLPAPSSNSRMLEASVQDDARSWHDTELGVLQGLVSMRYRLTPDIISTMVAAFRKHAGASSSSLKFGTLVFTTITKYGDEVCVLHWRQEMRSRATSFLASSREWQRVTFARSLHTAQAARRGITSGS